ncbi:MAG: hypothetical protein ABI648_04990 [Betaproteobacteria bacterium]|jgi:hypothetical protein
MRRYSVPQIFLLAIGLSLIVSGLFLDQIQRGWEHYRYPNAVYWQGMRLLPDRNQTISAAGEDTMVVKTADSPMARLTLFLRADDGLTPQQLVRALCARDSCNKSTLSGDSGDRAAANYRIGGEALQIVVIRLPGTNVWIEFKGPPDALQHFSDLIESVTSQLAQRNTAGQHGT